MHSSRMHTVRCSSRLSERGVSAQGDVCLGGVWLGCLTRAEGVCLGVCLGGCLPRGSVYLGSVCPGSCTPPPP